LNTWKDFRSDTVTQPTDQMREAMMKAEVGDDILGEDPTVKRLEEMGAGLFGKEAALFVISGTMANQVAMMTLTQKGDEVLVGEESHIYNLEVGGLAAVSGVQARPLKSKAGRFSLDDVELAIRPVGIQSPITRCICVENTYNLNRGIPLPAEYFAELARVVKPRGVQIYLDGARVFNASVALNTPLDRLCASADAMQVCLSKGLAAPVGSLLLGTAAFIDRARWVRQRLGGGMRQAGHMAAAGVVALETMMDRLSEDHANAKRLAEGLAAINPGLVDVKGTETNVVLIDFAPVGKDSQYVVGELLKRGIKIKPIGKTACRMITHYGLTARDIDEAVGAIRDIVGQ
jgi:threonine aldolase